MDTVAGEKPLEFATSLIVTAADLSEDRFTDFSVPASSGRIVPLGNVCFITATPRARQMTASFESLMSSRPHTRVRAPTTQHPVSLLACLVPTRYTHKFQIPTRARRNSIWSCVRPERNSEQMPRG